MATMLCLDKFSEVLFLFDIWFSWLPDLPCDIDDCLFDLICLFSLLPLFFSSYRCWLTPEAAYCCFWKALTWFFECDGWFVTMPACECLSEERPLVPPIVLEMPLTPRPLR